MALLAVQRQLCFGLFEAEVVGDWQRSGAVVGKMKSSFFGGGLVVASTRVWISLRMKNYELNRRPSKTDGGWLSGFA